MQWSIQRSVIDKELLSIQPRFDEMFPLIENHEFPEQIPLHENMASSPEVE